MSDMELVKVPEIGAVVRCKAALSRIPRGTSGQVKAILSQGDGLTVVIESIWGFEITISAREYSRFFEECDSRDVAWEYWASA